jgi:predicted aspartyl protease
VIEGRVTERRVPVIPIDIAGTVHWAVIDTGFNGDLELPESLRGQLHARWAAQSLAELAGGVCLVEDIYLVDFPFDGRIVVEAEASFVEGDDILIGTKLLGEHRLEIDFVNGTVRIERT